MTSAMWGIVVGMGVIFATSLYRYNQQAVPRVQPVRLQPPVVATQRTEDSFRERHFL
jgi:hypothetical protein